MNRVAQENDEPKAMRHGGFQFQSFLSLLKETVRSWNEHRALRLGAALAFYTVFAIAPLFLIVLAIAGFWFGEEAAQRQLFDQLYGLVGREGGEAIQAVVASANRPKAGTWATLIAVCTLFVGATGVFVQLQDALNTIWQVRRKPGRGLRFFIKDRLLSFAMVLAIGFLLLVSLVISASLAALSKFMSGLIPAQQIVWQILNLLVSLGLIGLLFALIFKVLPDVKIAWREVWIGALLSASFFDLGKFFLGLYLGRSSVTSAYGAAGSLIIILLWVYYASQTLFLGAEFTRAYAKRFGRPFIATPGAEFVTVKQIKGDKTPAPRSA
jgi:membrane protein